MKLVLLSDTHGFHPWIEVPDGDVLIHCGDWSQDHGSLDETQRFAEWVSALPHQAKVVIAGNHDFPAQLAIDSTKNMFDEHGVHYLLDSGVVLEGLRFWGSPWQPEFGAMAFNLARRGKAIRDKWAMIPTDVDVLVTHGPPYGVLDEVGGLFFGTEHVGCEELRRRVEQIRPRLHCFGHVHSAGGSVVVGGTRFVNAAICQEHLPMGTVLSQKVATQVGLRVPFVVDVE